MTARELRGPALDILRAVPPRPSQLDGNDSPPWASIVVLSYNRLPYLKTTLAVCPETLGGVPYELIVVNNGSRDGSVEFLRDGRQRGLLAKLVLLPEGRSCQGSSHIGFLSSCVVSFRRK